MDDEQRSVTRNLIVRKATELFGEKGYHAASMRDIAKACGMAPGSLYHHFPSKEAILEAVISSTSFLFPLESIAASHEPVEDRLRSAVRHIVAENLESRDRFWVTLHDMRFLPPEARDLLGRSLGGRRKILEALIVEGVGAGVFDVDDPAFVALNLIEMTNGVVMWYRSEGSRGPAEIADGIVNFAIKGLRGERSHS